MVSYDPVVTGNVLNNPADIRAAFLSYAQSASFGNRAGKVAVALKKILGDHIRELEFKLSIADKNDEELEIVRRRLVELAEELRGERDELWHGFGAAAAEIREDATLTLRSCCGDIVRRYVEGFETCDGFGEAQKRAGEAEGALTPQFDDAAVRAFDVIRAKIGGEIAKCGSRLAEVCGEFPLTPCPTGSDIKIDGGFCDTAAAATSSHFCSAERQFRYPLQYGSQRPPTAQWTVTGAGAAIVRAGGPGPYITHVTTGVITDAGVTDMADMGSAMAPAAYATLSAHFADTGRRPDYYDAIVTGDLGVVGSDILRALFMMDDIDLGVRYMDCGKLIYYIEGQDAHAGGSGCGCSAAVLCGHFLRGMAEGKWDRLLFAATGAMMSPTTSQQGESIPAICHAVAIERERVPAC